MNLNNYILDTNLQEVSVDEVQRSLDKEFFMFKSELAHSLSQRSGTDFHLLMDQIDADLRLAILEAEDEITSKSHCELAIAHYERLLACKNSIGRSEMY